MRKFHCLLFVLKRSLLLFNMHDCTLIVMNQIKTLEIMLVNDKVRERKREKAVVEEIKILSKETTLYQLTLLQLYPGQVRLLIPNK